MVDFRVLTVVVLVGFIFNAKCWVQETRSVQNKRHQEYDEHCSRMDLDESMKFLFGGELSKGITTPVTGLKGPVKNWPKTQPIEYTISDTVSQYADAIRSAIAMWEENTCLSFRENAQATTGLNFRSGTYKFSCFTSPVGKPENSDRLDIELPEKCDFEHAGAVAQAVGRALGLIGTQKRHDRDDHVTVHKLNPFYSVEEQDVYIKEDEANNNNYGVAYDIGSIMHRYGASQPGYAPQIVARNHQYQITMGNAIRPSFNDILLINKQYKCECPLGGSPCANGGYKNPKNCEKCVCPSGFGGSGCTILAKPENTNSECGGTLTASTTVQTLSGAVGEKETVKTVVDKYDYEYEEVEDVVHEKVMVCHWHIKAPQGQHVKIHIESIKGKCATGCKHGALEIKHENLTLTGSRLCCNEKDTERSINDKTVVGDIITTGNLAVVSLYSLVNMFEFSLKYEAVSAGPTPRNELTCADKNSKCEYWAASGFCNHTDFTPQYRAEKCLKTCYECKTPVPYVPERDCTDTDPNCPKDIDSGCFNTYWYRDYAAKVCGKTCYQCRTSFDTYRDFENW